MEELEGEWGTPDDVKPLSEAELNRYRSRLSRKRKPPDFNGLTLPPKVVRDAWFGSESESRKIHEWGLVCLWWGRWDLLLALSGDISRYPLFSYVPDYLRENAYPNSCYIAF